MATLDIRNFTRGAQPRALFIKAHKTVLPDWDISLVFAGEQRAQNLNRSLRSKDYVPNVLSYELGKKNGEVIICPSVAAKQAPAYGMSTRAFTLYLFIHGLLHLEGLRHGATMEQRERALTARILGVSLSSFNGTTHRNGRRYRNAPNEGSRRRGG